MTEFRFTNEHSRVEVADIASLLRKPRLWIPTQHDYPRHSDWIDKTEAHLAANTKRAMVAYMGIAAVGAIIYQRDPVAPETLEIRNISVAPDARGRYIGAFLLRNSEIEAAEHDYPGIAKITVDTKTTNREMVQFLLSQGYHITTVADLYETGTGLDVILTKNVAQS